YPGGNRPEGYHRRGFFCSRRAVTAVKDPDKTTDLVVFCTQKNRETCNLVQQYGVLSGPVRCPNGRTDSSGTVNSQGFWLARSRWCCAIRLNRSGAARPVSIVLGGEDRPATFHVRWSNRPSIEGSGCHEWGCGAKATLPAHGGALLSGFNACRAI